MLNLLQNTIFAVLLLTPTAFGADELRIHVIRPRVPISWASPRSLTLTSAVNSAGHDYAPIGHFAVGTEGSGRIPPDHVARRAWAHEPHLSVRGTPARSVRDGRLKTLRVPTTDERCEQMLEFLDRWIEAGSERVYGGGKDTAQGEGAGCADFAMQFFRIAAGEAPPTEWLARVAMPRSLMGGGGQKIAFPRLLARGQWAQAGEPSLAFQIADTDRVQAWFEPHAPLPAFGYSYARMRAPAAVWAEIAVSGR